MILESEKTLTKKQSEVLDYIKKYTAEHGYPPAIREIGAGLGLSSPATVHTHVKKLEEAGVIKTSSNKFRTIEILVENEYEEGKFCDKAYKEVYYASRRICERLGVDEDRDVELIINNLIDIGQHLSMKMYDYGVFFSSPSIRSS